MRYININRLEEQGNWPPEKWQKRVRKPERPTSRDGFAFAVNEEANTCSKRAG